MERIRPFPALQDREYLPGGRTEKLRNSKFGPFASFPLTNGEIKFAENEWLPTLDAFRTFAVAFPAGALPGAITNANASMQIGGMA